MRKLLLAVSLILSALIFPHVVLAASTIPEISSYTSDTLAIITIIASGAAVFFLLRGGYIYMTSTGRPDALEEAKKTIRNALIGLVLVLAANGIVSLLQGALVGSSNSTTVANLPLTQIESVKPADPDPSPY